MLRCVTAGLPMGQLSFSAGALPVIKTNENTSACTVYSEIVAKRVEGELHPLYKPD